MIKELTTKLDLDEFIKSFKAYFAREKPLFLEGDRDKHYQMIMELENYQYPSPPNVENLDIALIHLTKQGTLHLSTIWEFIKIISFFLKLSKVGFEDEIGGWIEKIIIPQELSEITFWFNEKGELKEEIDERFALIYSSLSSIKKEILVQFRTLFSTKRVEPYLVDRQIHLINSQEALLVRGGFNHFLKGSVIGRSSGGFFYVAPLVIENLKKKEGELLTKKEEIIYEYCKKISLLFAKYLPFLKFINRAFDRFDSYNARVNFAKDRDLEFLLPTNKEEIILKDFKHPALLNPKPISLNFQKSVLLVTGVNAGGKTMLLKSILSAVTLAKYLLPMPIDSTKSKIGNFKNIEAIIDDPQSVKNDISTFAGRMVEFSKLFRKKDKTLVGVDEIELGTDADEAATLFKVMIEHYIKQGIKLIITTHHKRLASLLATNDEVELLAALYDEKNQRPIYDFLHGTIGKSYAFETALRYGIPAIIISKVKKLHGEEKENLNELIQKNIDLELKMKQELAELKYKEEKLLKKIKKLEEKEYILYNKFEKKERELESEYEQAIKAAKDALKLANTKEAHRALNRAHLTKKSIKNKALPKVKNEALSVGDSVKYGQVKGVLKAIKRDIGTIESDGITLHLPLHSLQKSFTQDRSFKTKIYVEKPQNANMSIDLHGLRQDEALERLDEFLSQALVSGFDEVTIYHGIGSGRLAFAVKEFLKSYPKELLFTDAPANEGGFGATIVRL